MKVREFIDKQKKPSVYDRKLIHVIKLFAHIYILAMLACITGNGWTRLAEIFLREPLIFPGNIGLFG